MVVIDHSTGLEENEIAYLKHLRVFHARLGTTQAAVRPLRIVAGAAHLASTGNSSSLS
jgi:hypothetical protein